MTKRIQKLQNTHDDLVSRASKANSKRRRKMLKAALRINEKARNIITDCHRHTAKHLVQNYEVILLPHFNSQQMVQKQPRKINSQTARNLLQWRHYQFKMLLKAKSREYPNTRIVLVDEHHTSKTCSCCGTLNNDLHGSKTFNCVNPLCQFTTDRDWNASKNIFLRSLERELHCAWAPSSWEDAGR